ncbi:MAG: hypothetical protein [Inoviridae sp.]|nr:MAG: hypothetical protein [Inoviridae sp.]
MPGAKCSPKLHTGFHKPQADHPKAIYHLSVTPEYTVQNYPQEPEDFLQKIEDKQSRNTKL